MAASLRVQVLPTPWWRFSVTPSRSSCPLLSLLLYCSFSFTLGLVKAYFFLSCTFYKCERLAELFSVVLLSLLFLPKIVAALFCAKEDVGLFFVEVKEPVIDWAAAARCMTLDVACWMTRRDLRFCCWEGPEDVVAFYILVAAGPSWAPEALAAPSSWLALFAKLC